ncbi:hypothetical protein ACFXGT_21090 [Streptomyces sp. NPDC059352]|uniref:hypothetical protein n=1 Tax=Streptomyces sp. NPDC059352 TaxID=3346810 RepID=UPI0036C7BAEF
MNKNGFRAAAMTVPLLLAAVGCLPKDEPADKSAEKPAAEAPSPTAMPVYDERLGNQLKAATRATTASGSARFTATLTYGSARGAAVERTTGVIDYAKDTARVERSRVIPRGFPQEAAELVMRGGTTGSRHFVVEENDIAYRTAGGTWLRYSASDSKDFADLADGLLAYAGDAAPWGRTLAEVVKPAYPDREPETTADGGRKYRTTVDARTAATALPQAIAWYVDSRGSGKVPLTVVLDKDGRLLRAEADFGGLLGPIHARGMMTEVTSLRAEYVLTGHGRQTVRLVPLTERHEEAEQVLTTMEKVKPGSCASADTGLDTYVLVRVVPCGAAADLRVFGQVRVDETVQGDASQVGDEASQEKCRDRYRAAPDAWTEGVGPEGSYRIHGGASTSFAYTGPDATVSGDFTCYVELR